MHAGVCTFPIIVQGILCVPVAFAQITRETLSFACFSPLAVEISSEGSRRVYLS